MKKKNVLLILFVVVMIPFIVWVKRFLDIDSCLDNGGRWSYEKEECINYKEAVEIDNCLNAGGWWDYEKKVCNKP